MTIDIRPWGKFELITKTPTYWVKILTIDPGQSTSLQYHQHRTEYWIVLSGIGNVFIDGDTYDAEFDGPEFFIDRESEHRITNTSRTKDLVILEVAFGDTDESDILRLKDDYGRI